MVTTVERSEVVRSLDGHGYRVSIGDSGWRFGRLEFAEQFNRKLDDKNFRYSILEHAHGHNWEICEVESCLGKLWQMIQGLD